MARGPIHVPSKETEAIVTALASSGTPVAAIAKIMCVAEHTLRKYYGPMLKTAFAKASGAMTQNIYQKAMGDGPQAGTLAIFWAKTRMGWKEDRSQDDAARQVTTIVVKGGLPE